MLVAAPVAGGGLERVVFYVREESVPGPWRACRRRIVEKRVDIPAFFAGLTVLWRGGFSGWASRGDGSAAWGWSETVVAGGAEGVYAVRLVWEYSYRLLGWERCILHERSLSLRCSMEPAGGAAEAAARDGGPLDRPATLHEYIVGETSRILEWVGFADGRVLDPE